MAPRNGFSCDLDQFNDAIDALDRDDLARNIAKELRDHENCHNGQIIGLYGSWGAGKTHVLAQVIKHCIDGNQASDVYIIPCVFKAWRYETEGDLAPGLIRSLIQLPRHKEIKSRLALFDDDKLPAEGRKIAKELLELVIELSFAAVPAGQVVSGALTRIGKRIADSSVDSATVQPDDDDAAIDKVEKKMNQLVNSIIQQAKRKHPDKTPRLVIFIDDLDRCSPKNMVRLFEWLKNHLLVQDCVHLLALDHIAAARAIVGEYKTYLENDKDLAYGLRYLEKLIDSEYELDPSDKLESMAIQASYASGTAHCGCADLKALAEKIAGQQFAGIDLIPDLMTMPCLKTPRTTLKIVTKFTRVIHSFEHSPDYSEARDRLPAYPFWMLFMTAIYYRLEPDQFTKFVKGEMSIYNIMIGQDKAFTTDSGSSGPLADFERFAADFRRRTDGAVPMPDVNQRRLLSKLIHQN